MAFSVQFKHQPCEQHTLKVAHEIVKAVSTYFKSTVDELCQDYHQLKLSHQWLRREHLHQNGNITRIGRERIGKN